jgi:heme/copper-type cytochrome/quinol oxidase subunit 2
MADGKGPGRITTSGLVFGALMAILIIVSLWLFIAKPWWFPTLASVHGAEIDGVFTAVLIVTGIAFVVTQAVLGYFVARYGAAGNEKADYWHDNPKGEFLLLTGTALILVVLVFMGQRVWLKYYSWAPRVQPIRSVLTRTTRRQKTTLSSKGTCMYR